MTPNGTKVHLVTFGATLFPAYLKDMAIFDKFFELLVGLLNSQNLLCVQVSGYCKLDFFQLTFKGRVVTPKILPYLTKSVTEYQSRLSR